MGVTADQSSFLLDSTKPLAWFYKTFDSSISSSLVVLLQAIDLHVLEDYWSSFNSDGGSSSSTQDCMHAASTSTNSGLSIPNIQIQ